MSADKHFFGKKDFLSAEFFLQLSLRSVLPLALLDTPMVYLNAINSIDNIQNIPWDKGAYSLITETRSYVKASNVLSYLFSRILLFIKRQSRGGKTSGQDDKSLRASNT